MAASKRWAQQHRAPSRLTFGTGAGLTRQERESTPTYTADAEVIRVGGIRKLDRKISDRDPNPWRDWPPEYINYPSDMITPVGTGIRNLPPQRNRVSGIGRIKNPVTDFAPPSGWGFIHRGPTERGLS